MNVLSAFDGMSCGQIALNRLGVKVDKYFASEIDKFAIKGTQINFPGTIQIGSIVDVRGDDLPKIDLFLAGSPCQGFSNSGKGLNFEDPRSKLFFDFVRVLGELRQINPDIKFLLENVRMKKEWEDTISRILRIQPICINSALVCAQNRERLYWTNIAMSQRGLFDDKYCTIPQPKDRNIFLKDILQPTCEVEEKYYISEKAMARIMKENPAINPVKSYCIGTHTNTESGSRSRSQTLIASVGVISNMGEVTELQDGKSLCIDANYFKGAENHGQITMVREPKQVIQINPSTESGGVQPYQQNRVYDINGISPALTAELGGDRQYMIQIPHGFNDGGEVGKDGKCPSITTSSWEQNNLLVRERIRRLTPLEVCRLQTIPDDHFFKDGVQILSDSQIYKQCGNGWTVDVICHILSYLDK